MNLFDVYNLFDIEIARAQGAWLYDDSGNRYLDFYGGHAVISIGHSHPVFVQRITEQLGRIGFYSNSVLNSLQNKLAQALGALSGYDDYNLFLCNSGAEANENALKLASFHTGRKKIIAFDGAFHGRTSAAVAVTDNPVIRARINLGHEVVFASIDDYSASEQLIDNEACAVIIEGIQGVRGVFEPEDKFLRILRQLCDEHGCVLILDEVQSGYGRTGHFFAHQHAGIRPDIITVAKGMGNGFPVAGVLISPTIQARRGMLGTTFGGNHLACAASLAVLDVMRDEALMERSAGTGAYLCEQLAAIEGVREVRGRGLMLGVSLEVHADEVRKQLLFGHHIFTGSADDKFTIRLLPPMIITDEHVDIFLQALRSSLSEIIVEEHVV